MNNLLVFEYNSLEDYDLYIHYKNSNNSIDFVYVDIVQLDSYRILYNDLKTFALLNIQDSYYYKLSTLILNSTEIDYKCINFKYSNQLLIKDIIKEKFKEYYNNKFITIY